MQSLPVKIFHWINLLSLTLMITSGLQIYNANPVFGGRGGWHFPPILLLGGWLAGGRHWHFAAMTIFSLNLFFYGIYILVTRRWKIRFFSGKDLEALQKTRNKKRTNYAWHRLLYTMIIGVLLLSIFTGVGMYKPAQFDWIVDVFGSWQALRIVHFIGVPLFVIYSIVHSRLAFKIGGSNLVKSIFLQ